MVSLPVTGISTALTSASRAALEPAGFAAGLLAGVALAVVADAGIDHELGLRRVDDHRIGRAPSRSAQRSSPRLVARRQDDVAGLEAHAPGRERIEPALDLIAQPAAQLDEQALGGAQVSEDTPGMSSIPPVPAPSCSSPPQLAADTITDTTAAHFWTDLRRLPLIMHLLAPVRRRRDRSYLPHMMRRDPIQHVACRSMPLG
mgnify:CR=1 FL=1